MAARRKTPTKKASQAISVPPELAVALRKNPKAAAAWKALPPSHRKAHVDAIAKARLPETKARRVAAAIVMLLSK